MGNSNSGLDTIASVATIGSFGLAALPFLLYPVTAEERVNGNFMVNNNFN